MARPEHLHLQASFDLIIVGAGAAGCVLAARLSEAEHKRVLLIEAGPDAKPGREHPHILDSFPATYGNPRFFWTNLTAESGADPGDGRGRVSTPYLQPFGVGGGSNVNGMAADRCQPSDYDEWCALGAEAWAWKDVLPYFRRLEHDLDFTGDLHGIDGPMPVRRVSQKDWAPFAKAVAHAFVRRGAALVDDSNGNFSDGVSPVPMNCLADRRVSASMAYLTADVRNRRNLTILDNTKAERLSIRSGRICGVQVQTPHELRSFGASEVIVSCGAVFSPVLLLRSGIGPVEHLRAIGIDVVCDLPGVGRNLQNHPWVPVVTHLRRTATQPANQRAWQQNQVRYSSGRSDCAQSDMSILVFNKSGWHSLGRRIATLGVELLKPYSTGYVELRSRHADVSPNVCFNLLEDSRDFERMVDGVLIALDVLAQEDVRQLHNGPFVPNLALEERLAFPNIRNTITAFVLSIALQLGPLRRAALAKRLLKAGSASDREVAVRDYVRVMAQAIYHPSGSCRMGNARDSRTVVDPHCRVLGIRGLRVVDASIFPTVPRGQTHFPVLMVAEKMADVIKADWRLEATTKCVDKK